MEQQTVDYLNLARQMLDEAYGDERQQWISSIVAELPQIREVFAWLKAQRRTADGLELAYGLQEIWFEDQFTQEGLDMLQQFLAMDAPEASLPMRAMCLDLAGGLAINVDRLELAHSLKEEAISLFQQLGFQRQLGYALLHYGHLRGYAESLYDQADRLYSEALEIFTGLDDPGGVAHATANLASVKLELGDYGSAQALVTDSLRRYSALNSQWDLALTLGNAAGVAVAQGRFEEAVLLAAASSAHRARIGITLPNTFKSRYENIEEKALSSVAEGQRAVLWTRGQSLTIVQAVKFALENKNISS